MIGIGESSGNVYVDLGRPDAGEMLVKSRLAAKIGEVIGKRHLTRQHDTARQVQLAAYA